MKNYVATFPGQIEEALHIASKVNFDGIDKGRIRNILISGLGGSGIGGTIVAELVSGSCPLPVTVNKDYSIPHFVDDTTLLVVCSYSGNTEETISVLQSGLKKRAQVICISSGGTISEIAQKNNLTLIKIPGGHPPRASFGYPLVQLLNIFGQLGFSSPGYKKELQDFVSSAKRMADDIRISSMEMARRLLYKIPVIYSISGNEGVAIRFRQQVNENSKMLCWHHVIPEMNHNELVGWVEKNDNLAVVALRTDYDFDRSVKRLEICRTVIEPLASSFDVLFAKGNSKIEQTLYLVHYTDWVSVHLADLKKIDPVEVNVINQLKNQLANY